MWSTATTTLQLRLRTQLNSLLFAKTLIRKDVASSAASPASTDSGGSAKPVAANGEAPEKEDDDSDFSSKAQVMTLMTTDVDRVSDFSWHVFSLVGPSIFLCSTCVTLLILCFIDSPVEIVIGSIFLYKLLGDTHFL